MNLTITFEFLVELGPVKLNRMDRKFRFEAIFLINLVHLELSQIGPLDNSSLLQLPTVVMVGLGEEG